MPRPLVKYCSHNPYHIVAKSNNGDWFDVPMDYCMQIYINVLRKCIDEYQFRLHAFVLMSNHFHMIGSTPKANIGEVLRYFMTETSRGIKNKSQRLNHIYGARNYKALITNPAYYAHCYKYIFRNPVRAEICQKIEDYKWSSLFPGNKIKKLITEPTQHAEYIPKNRYELLCWLNEPTNPEHEERCRKAMHKTEFVFNPNRKNQKSVDIKLFLPRQYNAPHPQKV